MHKQISNHKCLPNKVLDSTCMKGQRTCHNRHISWYRKMSSWGRKQLREAHWLFDGKIPDNKDSNDLPASEFRLGLQLGLGLPGSSDGKESACNTGDLGSIPGLGRSPGEGNGYPLQYSGLENSMDCIVHGIAKSQRHNRATFTFTFHEDWTRLPLCCCCCC